MNHGQVQTMGDSETGQMWERPAREMPPNVSHNQVPELLLHATRRLHIICTNKGNYNPETERNGDLNREEKHSRG